MTAATDTRKRSTGLAGVTNLAVLAPLRTGMVVNAEPIGYAHRLEKVLDALHASRKNLRESELLTVFPDVIGRFGILQNFRYALVAPEPGPDGAPNDDGVWRLSLNVTFDGGWEPYMRVIYRDIGTLLDLLFCHSPDYPGSRTSSFEDYCKWVRKYEVPAGLFYADTPVTLEDQHFFAEVDALENSGKEDAGKLARRHALPPGKVRDAKALAKAMRQPARVLALPLRTLRGLYRLSTYFPLDPARQDEGDAGVLRRFAREVLEDAIRLMNEVEKLSKAAEPPSGMTKEQLEKLKETWKETKANCAEELEWLRWEEVPAAPQRDPGRIDPAKLQSQVLGAPGEKMTHGCLALLHVEEAQMAITSLVALAPRAAVVPAAGEIGTLVAFTYPGLEALGLSPDRLAALPQEFFEGMEARCGLLGDVRSNHPDRWSRPPWHDMATGKPRESGQQVDLATVHVLVQLRLQDDAASMKDIELHPKLRAEAQALGAPGTGLCLMAIEPMRSYRNDTHAVGHLDMADGLSQPVVHGQEVQGKVAPADIVAAGELFLGHRNDRGDAAQAKDFLQDGSFLVVRKLRQWMDRLDEALAKFPADEQQLIKAKMMGRRADGKPLCALGENGDNDFNFDKEEDSRACPHASHVRRANPRDGRPYTPRILRRGMSYGPKSASERKADRGVMFMAYCASISEQFETIQRWIAGGNSSGVNSAQADPFLRVPREKENRTFRYREDGEPVLFDDRPLVQLQWGLYALVPSLSALRSLAKFTEAGAEEGACVERKPSDLERARASLEDRHGGRNVRTWAKVRGKKVPQDTAYGFLLGTADEVLAAMKDSGKNYSVQGYGQRKAASVGINFLGMDPDDPRRQAEIGASAVIAAVDEPTAFGAATLAVEEVLGRLPLLPAGPGDPERRPVDLVTFSDYVLAGLCTAWFGLPDGKHMVAGGRVVGNDGTPRCPGNLNFPSRYVFTPQLTSPIEAEGRLQGRKVLEAVRAWLATKQVADLPPLTRGMHEALARTNSQGRLAENIAGMLIGFTPTVQGNFLRVMDNWITDGRKLWEMQQRVYRAAPDGKLGYAQAEAALRDALFAAMRADPVPGMLWRSPVRSGKADLSPDQCVVLGIASALTDPAAPRELVFGRDRDDAQVPTVHGCPGYHMAMGVLLAMIGGLLKRGNLRPTGSPVLLILTPNAPPPASP